MPFLDLNLDWHDPSRLEEFMWLVKRDNQRKSLRTFEEKDKRKMERKMNSKLTSRYVLYKT